MYSPCDYQLLHEIDFFAALKSINEGFFLRESFKPVYIVDMEFM